MGAVLAENFLRLVVGLQIVVAIGKAQAALVKLGDDLGGVVVILLAGEAEEGRVRLVVAVLPRSGEKVMQVGDLQRDFFLRFQGGDARQFRLQRLQAGGFDAAFVHAGGPVVANLLLDGGALGIVGAGGDHGFAQQIFVPQLKAATCAPVDLIRGNGIGGQPFVAGVLVEIVAGIERFVGRVWVEVLELGRFSLIGRRALRVQPRGYGCPYR